MTRASTLCSECGLCCDGALFSSVSLDAAGLITAREHHLPILETAHGWSLELPCPALRGTLCEVYEGRPECCAEYECELRARVEGRRMSLEEARRVIERLRRLRSQVVEAVGARPWWTAHRSAVEAARQDPGWALDNGELLANLNALEKTIRRYFWG